MRRAIGRSILLECDPDECPRGEACHNCHITWKKTHPHIAVAPCGVVAAGFGVFATRDIPAGEFVLEYKGTTAMASIEPSLEPEPEPNPYPEPKASP